MEVILLLVIDGMAYRYMIDLFRILILFFKANDRVPREISDRFLTRKPCIVSASGPSLFL